MRKAGMDEQTLTLKAKRKKKQKQNQEKLQLLFLRSNIVHTMASRLPMSSSILPITLAPLVLLAPILPSVTEDITRITK